MDFETDPAAEFLSREKEVLGDLEGEIVNNNDEVFSEPQDQSSSDDFVMVNNEENEESFVGMKIHSNMPVQREIPEKIRIWQENHKLMIEQKDKDEQESIERLRQEGKEELSKWMENNRTNIEKIKAHNRMDEASMNGDNITSEGDMWKSINELCEFSQQKIKNGRDTSRMKSIFLQLKQNPINKNA